MNLRLKKVKKDLKTNFTLRMSAEEYNNIQQKALVHTNGNVSEWIRYAAQNCTPRKSDFAKDDK